MRLTDFESRRVDELAPATLASYKTKAGAAATAADAAGDRKTADKRFSGIVKATKKQFDQDAKGVSEDSDDTVRFEVDSENAYNHVMDQFGSVIDWDGDTMVAPRKYWGAIQELALAASGEASEEQGMAEGAPELLKKEMPLHRHAEKLLAQNGVSKDDPDYHHHLGNTIKHLRQFGNIDLINKNDEQGVAEGFDQPYSLKWEKSDYGDVDALAKLPDGSPLSIMFSLADMSENDWGVEFYRNNSQSVTGEGNAQRVFATVLTAIGQFVKKKKPDTLFFSTVKEEDPTGSRAKLYDRLVQRYATGLGYDLKKVEYPEQTGYKLTRKEQGVAEGSNDYFKRRKDEEDRIAGTKAPAKHKPQQTDYAKRRAQEKKSEQGVAKGQQIDEVFADQGSGSTDRDNADYMKRRRAAKNTAARGSVTKKPQPYNDPNWIDKLSKEQLDALAGRNRNKDKKDVTEMDKSEPSAGRDTGPRSGPDKQATPITTKKATKDARDILTKAFVDVKDTHKKKDIAEDSLEAMRRLAGIVPQIPLVMSNGQRQYRHMPTAVQPR